MAETGDWITPWFEPGVPFWGKPPLSFWAQAAAIKVFGVSEFSLRFPSWLATLAMVWLVWRLARQIWTVQAEGRRRVFHRATPARHFSATKNGTARGDFLARRRGRCSSARVFSELRTPLAVMSGALNVLEQRQSLSAADQKTLARIRRAMQTMRDDTDVLLELARSEAPESDARTVVLQEVVQNTVDDLEHGLPEHAGRITVYNNSPSLRVTTHPALVRMLLRNLLQNALRHTHAGVEVQIIENRISVRDFGSGLPENITEHLNAIGAPSAITSTAGEFSNTTFGLLIVRLVCERLGWDLEIAQSNNEGTEFLIHVHNLV